MDAKFDAGQVNPSGPPTNYDAITPSDTVDLPRFARAIRVGRAGDVVLVNAVGVAVMFVGCQEGEILPGASRVNATGTTATDLVAYYD